MRIYACPDAPPDLRADASRRGIFLYSYTRDVLGDSRFGVGISDRPLAEVDA